MNPYTALFSPLILNNNITLKNRLVVAPMTHYGSNPDGSLSEQESAFLQGRATDFGMFISAATLVSPNGYAFLGQPFACGEADLPSLRQRADIIKDQGAKAILQIHHGGDRAIGVDVVAPSASDKARALDEAEIFDIINDFARATDLAIRAGFDGVEIHGANGYLIQQFVSAQTNHRTDAWGGDRVGRLRFALSVVDAVVTIKQQHARPDFIIGYRFSPEEGGDKGLTMSDTFALLDALLDKPLQYLHVSLWDFYKKVRRGADTNLTRMQVLHEYINGRLPLIGVGNLLSAEQILTAYQHGWADLLALGKAVMINPNIATLLKNNDTSTIATTIDLARDDHYHFPDNLWAQQQQGLAYLPPLEGKNWQPVDI